MGSGAPTQHRASLTLLPSNIITSTLVIILDPPPTLRPPDWGKGSPLQGSCDRMRVVGENAVFVFMNERLPSIFRSSDTPCFSAPRVMSVY